MRSPRGSATQPLRPSKTMENRHARNSASQTTSHCRHCGGGGGSSSGGNGGCAASRRKRRSDRAEAAVHPVSTPAEVSEQRAVDTSVCPICGRANLCAMAAGETDEPCWCTQVVIDPRVLDRVPPEMLGVVCVCAACAVGEARSEAGEAGDADDAGVDGTVGAVGDAMD